jgi:hypothetical protein
MTAGENMVLSLQTEHSVTLLLKYYENTKHFNNTITSYN